MVGLVIKESGMTRIVVVFLDGVGLGEHDSAVNPLVAARLPVMAGLLDGAPLVAGTGRIDTGKASMAPTDASLGVRGRPQSATGQTALLTGLNAPQLLGEHYGPRPNAQLREMLQGETLFTRALAAGRRVAFVNAYPQRLFRGSRARQTAARGDPSRGAGGRSAATYGR